MTEKLCPKCNLLQPLSEFWKDSRSSTGYRSWCKHCLKDKDNERAKAWSKSNAERKLKTYNRNKLDRIAKGLCRHCLSESLPNRNVCERHYVTDVASRGLGKADSKIVDILLKRFHSNPVCPYAGIPLILGINAHLDHILSTKNRPDLKGDINNVEWISEAANLSKNGFNKDEFIEFCKLVAKRFG